MGVAKMARPKSLVPKLYVDRSRNHAFCKIDGRKIRLGPAGSSEAQAAYGRLLTDLARHGPDAAINAATNRGKPAGTTPAVSLNDVFLRFVTEELPRYSKAEQFCIKSAIKITREMFGETPAAEFGPLRLRMVREAMITQRKWSRSFINKEIKRLRLVLRWAVGWEMIPPAVIDALTAVKALGPGDSDAPESRPRRAIPDADLAAVRAVLSDQHRDVFDLLLLTGARPGELLTLTTGMIDRSGRIWRAEIGHHKTRHFGKNRVLFFNERAQEILARHLKDAPDAPLFKLARSYFGKVIRRSCEIAFGMPAELRGPNRNLTPLQRASADAWRREHCWSPHWLRHTVATKLADLLGTEAAQRVLGHATAAMTEHYSVAAEAVARDAVKHLG